MPSGVDVAVEYGTVMTIGGWTRAGLMPTVLGSIGA
jgi:hypothetical protein